MRGNREQRLSIPFSTLISATFVYLDVLMLVTVNKN